MIPLRDDCSKLRIRRTFPRAVLSLLCAAAALQAGCAVPGSPLAQGNAANPQLETKVYDVSCDEGLRLAAKAFKSRSYRITAVDRTANGGVVHGHHEQDGVDAQLDIACVAGGVTATPSGGGAWVTQGLRFGFYQVYSFRNQMYPPPTQPVVRVDLYRGPEAKIEFPQEIEPAGVVAVRVEVLNAGDRAIRIDPMRVHARTASGSTAMPLPVSEAQKRLSFDPKIGEKVLKPTKLNPKDKVVGFVFFPVADYTGATLFLIDDKTGEADEFDVSFTATA